MELKTDSCCGTLCEMLNLLDHSIKHFKHSDYDHKILHMLNKMLDEMSRAGGQIDRTFRLVHKKLPFINHVKNQYRILNFSPAKKLVQNNKNIQYAKRTISTIKEVY